MKGRSIGSRNHDSFYVIEQLANLFPSKEKLCTVAYSCWEY